MKSLKFGLIAIAAIVSFNTVTAQTVDEIVNKHLDALGGKSKIAQINSLHTESSFDIQGQQAPSSTTILNGKGFRSEVDFGGQKIIQVVTDKAAWGINALAGQTAPTPMPEDQAKSGREQIYIGGALFNYAEKGNKIELAGREDVKGVNTYKLKVTGKEGNESTYYIDPATYYIVKRSFVMSANGEKTETSTFFSNYKKTDFGYVMPYTMEIQLPQITLVNTVNKIEINQPVAENFFNQ